MKIQNSIRTALAIGVAALTIGAVGCMEWPKDPVKKGVITRMSVDGLPTVIQSKETTGQAKIAGVDFDKRTVDLLDSKGKVTTFKVPKEVVNFPQIKKGDVVTVHYSESIEASLRKVNEEVKVTDTGFLATAPKGDKPGLFAYRTVESLCDIKEVNAAERKVTLVGVSDKPVTLKVSELVPDFDKIKPGDQVIFTYTESMLIDVAGK